MVISQALPPNGKGLDAALSAEEKAAIESKG